MKRDGWLGLLGQAIGNIEAWEGRLPDRDLPGPDADATRAIAALTERLQGSYPFTHPLYAGHMLRPPHPLAWVAHAAASVLNCNNHARDGGPVTSDLEVEAVAALAKMLGYRPEQGGHLGHLTTSGTLANLEALWVARESRPGKRIAYGANAHYTHGRMCSVLEVEGVAIPADADGRMDVAALQRELETGTVGTVVVTPGTTGLGSIDPVDAIMPLARAHDVRVHVDAAYGGFFTLLARRSPPLVRPEPYAAIGQADSIVIDPHKHGLQPYGCGCILFADPAAGHFYRHDSPYTYFTSSKLHLGEISLECSRAGAAAAALWTTLQAIPLEPDRGVGEIVAAGRRAALAWAEAIEQSESLALVMQPETDIICFAPLPATGRRVPASTVGRWCERVFREAMTADPPAWIVKLRLDAHDLARRWPGFVADVDSVEVLRAVVMKPEHEQWWPTIHGTVERLANEAITAG